MYNNFFLQKSARIAVEKLCSYLRASCRRRDTSGTCSRDTASAASCRWRSSGPPRRCTLQPATHLHKALVLENCIRFCLQKNPDTDSIILLPFFFMSKISNKERKINIIYRQHFNRKSITREALLNKWIISFFVLNRPLEEPFAGFAGEQAVVVTRNLDTNQPWTLTVFYKSLRNVKNPDININNNVKKVLINNVKAI